jgi:hypothetical protein
MRTVVQTYACKFFLGSWDKHSYAMFVDGKEIYYTGRVFTLPSIYVA